MDLTNAYAKFELREPDASGIVNNTEESIVGNWESENKGEGDGRRLDNVSVNYGTRPNASHADRVREVHSRPKFRRRNVGDEPAIVAIYHAVPEGKAVSTSPPTCGQLTE